MLLAYLVVIEGASKGSTPLYSLLWKLGVSELPFVLCYAMQGYAGVGAASSKPSCLLR